MQLNTSVIGLLFTILALPVGCAKAPPSASAPQADLQAVVARFSGGEIRRSEIQEAVENQLAAVPRPVAPETRQLMVKKVVERRVRLAMLIAEAKAKGYEARPEVQFQAAAAAEKLLAADFVASAVASVHAADSLVAAALESRLKSVHPEEARKFSHIYLRAAESDAAARAAAEAKMQGILAELKSGTGFNALAERHSDSVDARGGGRIDWTLRKDLQRAAAEAIFSLQEGGLSPVVASKDGLHLFRLDGIRSGAPLDVEGIRRAVRNELDGEARAIAAGALRQQELDAAGVEFAPLRSQVPPAEAADRWVARWKGGEVRAAEFRALRLPADVDPARAGAYLRELVENRLLAARRRAQGLTPALEKEVVKAERDALVDVYRAALIAEIPTEPTAEEVARYYRENGESALFLRDFRLDVLYFAQSGESVADVYAAGEKVVSELRAGSTFDRLLDLPPGPGARVCRDAQGIDLEDLGRHSIRLRKAILNLGASEVTPAVYLDGPMVVLGSDCRLEGRGVAFVRLREIRTLPLESSGPLIRAVLRKEKEQAGIGAIQARLIAASGLVILLPEG